jgi:hypothetical protein
MAPIFPVAKRNKHGANHEPDQRPGGFPLDFTRVFTLLTEAGYTGWAVLEWQCCVKNPERGAREGAPFITRHLIEATYVAFDDFAAGSPDAARNRSLLGLE